DAAYDGQRACIYLSTAVEPERSAYLHAHELSHHWLDGTAGACDRPTADDAMGAATESALVGETIAYGPKERAEAYANVHGGAFLRRGDELGGACRERGAVDAPAIAREVGLPLDVVLLALAEALLLPPEDFDAEDARDAPAPDPSQRRAIAADAGAWQVSAP